MGFRTDFINNRSNHIFNLIDILYDCLETHIERSNTYLIYPELVDSKNKVQDRLITTFANDIGKVKEVIINYRELYNKPLYILFRTNETRLGKYLKTKCRKKNAANDFSFLNETYCDFIINLETFESDYANWLKILQ